MRLPFAERAVVAEAKLVRYLLDAEHPRGRHKASFFLGAGFRREAPAELRETLLHLARTSDMAAVPGKEGTKYVGVGPALAPNGRRVWIQTVWVLDGDQPPPRLVTAYPARPPVR